MSFVKTFDLKKSASIVCKNDDEADVSGRSYKWFYKFINDEFDVDDNELSGRPKM